MNRPAIVQSEGDTNSGERRNRWRSGYVGKESRSLLARDEKVFLKQSLSTPCLTAIRRAEGIWLEDMDGRRFMDFHGNSAHHLGHGHPRVREAIRRQLDELPFAPRRLTCEPAVALAERLVELAPPGLDKVLFVPGGSEAVEVALKLARVATGRYKTLSFWDSFHGAGFGAASVSGERLFRSHGIGPLLTGSEHVPPFACYRCPFGFPSVSGQPDLDACRMACARTLAYTLEREGDFAAFIAEPVRNVPYLPPPDFWAKVRKSCDEHGTLLIFDEIPTGLGRTGRLFVCEHFETTPDILVLGKALGGGMLPLAAVLARSDLDLGEDLAVGHYTHEKNPVLASAALATLDVIVEEGLAERAAELGRHALARLGEIAASRPVIGEVRGMGLIIGVELITAGGQPGDDIATATMYSALSRGLNFKVTMGNVLTLTPPLIITYAELDTALDILADSIDEAISWTPA
ncbi:MAG: aspartate aminotransferase family protein [Rhodospirillales bacterium]|nr:aspartate aminotransferase family protein [Rhodospirillales bacterium]